MIWIPEGLKDDDTDGHIDNILCPIGNRKYLIAKSKGNLPNCLILKKIDEIYAKRSIRNFLIKNKLYKKDVFKIVKNNCKI